MMNPAQITGASPPMSLQTMLRSVLAAIVPGLLFFAAVMAATLGLIVLNTRVSPGFAWFPLPATLLIIAATWGAEHRWHIGLRNPARVSAGRAYGIGLGLTVLGVAACALQGYFSGYERATELLDADVDRTFQRTYAIYMAVFAAVLAEVTFRGIMQVGMQRVLGGWPVVIIIGVVNVLAHRWGPEITHNGIGLFVVLAGWTYLRWVTQSLWPPLVMHVATNLIVGLWLWYQGSIVHADMSPAGATAVAMAGLLGLLLSVRLIKGSKPKP